MPTTTHSPHVPRRSLRSRAFTLIELIVTLVVIALLIAVAAVSYNSVIGHSKDTATGVQLTQLYKTAAGVAALNREPLTLAHFENASAEVTLAASAASQPPALAAGHFEVLPAGTPVTHVGQVQVAVTTSDTGTQVTGLAALSRDGHCVLVRGENLGTRAAPQRSDCTEGSAEQAQTLSADNAVLSTSPTAPSSTPTAPAQATAPARMSAATLTASDQQLAVAWEAPSDGGAAIESYQVTLTPPTGGPQTRQVSAPQTMTVFTGLANGATYTVTVTATNSAGTSPTSPAASAAPVGVPSQPRQVTAVLGTPVAGQVTISWQGPADNGGSAVNGYRLYRAAAGSAAWDTSALIWTGTQTTSIDSPQQPGSTSWCYRVSAYNAAGESALSEPSCTLVQVAGSLVAWGYNTTGQLGDGTTTNRLAPVAVPTMTDVTTTAAYMDYTLAVKADGTVWAWGANTKGQLGDGTTTARSVPGQVSGLTNVKAVAAGDGFAVALKTDGTVWAWGTNSSGQLGNGTSTASPTPVQVPGLTGVTAVTAGQSFAAALMSDGTVRTWGSNASGQLGDGTNTLRKTPVSVTGLSGVTAFSAGWSHMAAVAGGQVWVWGINGAYQLGTGSTTNSFTPTKLALTGITSVAAGNVHTLALAADGTVWAWGANNYGRLGDGSTTDAPRPVHLSTLANVTAVAAGVHHSAALKSDGTVWTWGYNTAGQLGIGTTTRQLSPVQVPSLTGVAKVFAGGMHTLVVQAQ